LNIGQAVQCLQLGKVIAYPTEAVFGLGCDPLNENAVRQILALKQRPESAGLILIADDFSRFRSFIESLSEQLKARAMAVWPGPVTWLVPKSERVPPWLAGEHQTIALRIPNHPVCQALCKAYGGAIVSTSANPGGKRPAVSAQDVEAYFGASLCGTVEGLLGAGDKPSEIRDLVSGRVLRGG
jgi:L-threonylcarbamoyladenylate synthase